jgi:hypothetical protein
LARVEIQDSMVKISYFSKAFDISEGQCWKYAYAPLSASPYRRWIIRHAALFLLLIEVLSF